MRNRICMAIITATPCGIIVHREKKQVIKQRIAERDKVREYTKRHDEFMAIGGTRKLKNYSDNIAVQIALFRQQKLGVVI